MKTRTLLLCALSLLPLAVAAKPPDLRQFASHES